MGLGDLLRAGRVLGAGFRLFGRYRAAVVVSFVLAVGWLVVGLAGRSDAHAGAGTYADQFAGDLGAGALWVLFAVAVVAGVCWLGVAGIVVGRVVGRWGLRHGGPAVRRADRG